MPYATYARDGLNYREVLELYYPDQADLEDLTDLGVLGGQMASPNASALA